MGSSPALGAAPSMQLTRDRSSLPSCQFPGLYQRNLCTSENAELSLKMLLYLMELMFCKPVFTHLHTPGTVVEIESLSHLDLGSDSLEPLAGWGALGRFAVCRMGS